MADGASTQRDGAPVALERFVGLRAALVVTAASKTGQADGALTCILQVDTESAPVTKTDTALQSQRTLECDLTPAQLFTLLTTLEEASAKLSSRNADDA